jgi:amidase
MTHELIKLTAREAVTLLRKRQVSPLELVDAAIARIEEVDRAVNALPIRCFDRARDQAKTIMGEGTKALERRLVGLPIAVKDLSRLSGVRTTWGSPVFQDYVADRSDIGVETLERNGAIPVAKSNVPELGIGANTTNPVFGATRNPWNTDLTCGGSSGGAAVSVATGAVWLAGGSDGGCSLRVPASFCSVATLRPTPGRVASGTTSQVGPRHSLWETLSVEGPIGRTVGDVALMFEAQIGAHPLDPRSMPLDGTSFIETVDAPTVPRRIAFSRDLGGVTKVATEVGDICAKAAARFEDLGVVVEEACPDLSDASDVYRILRAHSFVMTYGPVVEANRERIKRDMIWNVEQGMKLTSGAIAKAERRRADIVRRMATFFERYDVLLCPAACAPPFDVKLPALMELEGHRFETYYDWYAICFVISLTTFPAMSVPCGFTGNLLPVGLQIIGPLRGEARLLNAAKLVEDMAGISGRLPIDPGGPAVHASGAHSRVPMTAV